MANLFGPNPETGHRFPVIGDIPPRITNHPLDAAGLPLPDLFPRAERQALLTREVICKIGAPANGLNHRGILLRTGTVTRPVRYNH
jgi:hypothetical protein